MDDILASIRRILNEEDAKPPEDGSAAVGVAKAAAVAHEEDVLQLDPAMLVPDEDEAEPMPSPSMAQAVIAVPQAPEMPQPVPSPMVSERPLAVPFPTPTLVAPEVAASAAASVGALLRTLATERSTAVYRGGPTLEDLVREEMRPILKEWLDSHLPPLVERLVRAEIERVVGRMA